MYIYFIQIFICLHDKIYYINRQVKDKISIKTIFYGDLLNKDCKTFFKVTKNVLFNTKND